MTQKEIEQTEIEAPYELPDGWKWEKLGNLFTHTTGKALNKENTVGSLKKYITTSNLYWNEFDFSDVREMYFTDDEVEKCTATKGDLLICNGGDVGRAAIWNFDYDICLQNHISKLRKKNDNVSTEFFYYIFLFYKDSGFLSGKGIGISSLSAKTITNLNIPLPPTLSEQQRIVNRIETMFAKLDQAQEKAQAVLDSFETRKAAILHKAFTGELTANWRKEHGVPDDSWAEKTVGDCLIVISDKYDPEKDTIDGIQYIGLENIESSGGIISTGDISSVKSLKTLFKRNDLLYGKLRPYLDKHDIAYFDGICSTDILVYRSKPEYEIKFFNYLFSQKSFIQHAVENSKGINLPRTSEKIISAYSQKVPSLPEQQEIVRSLDTVLEKESRAKEAAQTVLDQIAMLKKSILARAFRGEL